MRSFPRSPVKTFNIVDIVREMAKILIMIFLNFALTSAFKYQDKAFQIRSHAFEDTDVHESMDIQEAQVEFDIFLDFYAQ